MRKIPIAFFSVAALATFAQAQLVSAQSLKKEAVSEKAIIQTEPDTRFLSWEHSLTTHTSSSKYAMAKLKIYNNWTPGKHRLLVKYNVAGLGAANDFIGRSYGSSFSMPDFATSRISEKASYHNGTLGLVTNLDADKLMAYSSESGEHGEYFIENRKALMKRLRFDPWKKIAPELSKDDMVTLTPAQRKRLGREVRSSLRPVLKSVVKTYFRPIKNARTFTVADQKIEAKGYRMTILMNAGGYYSDEEWVRTSFEWWLAPEMEGDGTARSFLGKVLRDQRESGGPTTSMWMNETLPLVWASMPQEFHAALATLVPQALNGDAAADGSTPAFTGGTPVYAAVTLRQVKPRYGRCPSCGTDHIPLPGPTQYESIRMQLQLQNRHTRALAPKVFEAPAEYAKESLEPILKEWEEGIEMLQGIYDEDTLLASAPTDSSAVHRARPQYTWRAFKDYTRKVNALMLNVR